MDLIAWIRFTKCQNEADKLSISCDKFCNAVVHLIVDDSELFFISKPAFRRAKKNYSANRSCNLSHFSVHWKRLRLVTGLMAFEIKTHSGRRSVCIYCCLKLFRCIRSGFFLIRWSFEQWVSFSRIQNFQIKKLSNNTGASNAYIAQLIPYVSFKNQGFCSTSRVEKQCELRNVYNLKIAV